MINSELVFLLTLGIILLKAFWIMTDHDPIQGKFTVQMLQSNIIEAIILVLQVVCAYMFPWPFPALHSIFTILGIFLYVLGTVLTIWARLTMQQNWGYPGKHAISIQRQLVTSGPFTFSRNPIYVGWTLLYIGYCLAIRSYLIILRIPLFIYFYSSAKTEEKNLMKHFGKAYQAYKMKVPRFLFI